MGLLIKKTEFAKRRRQLLAKMEPNSLAIIFAATHQLRNRDVEYPYHPASDFYYLSGFAESDAILLLRKGGAVKGNKNEYIIFCQERDFKQEQWVGERVGTERARTELGASRSWSITAWKDQLSELLIGVETLYYNLGEEGEVETTLLQQLKQFRQRSRAGVIYPKTVNSLNPLLHELRLRKSSTEIRAMQKAAEITVAAHKRAMVSCRAGITESVLEGEILHSFSGDGVRTVAYDSIVAGGNNACTLHYINNSDTLKGGDLVLIDAGAEYEGYAADVTRTFPVNGKFSEPQRQLYELVLKAQQAAIKQIKPGVRCDAAHRAAVRVITRGLIDLKLLKGDLQKNISDKKYEKFYMHQTGHWLGMDVHDVGEYKVADSSTAKKLSWRKLESGMVLTIEPGLYIPKGMKGVAKRWQGIGIRIEDDLLVTETGCKVLTEAAPKSVVEIEALMRVR